MRKNKKTAGISAKQTGKKIGGTATVKQLMPYLGRRRLSLLLTLLLAAASVVLQLYVPVLFGSAMFDDINGFFDDETFTPLQTPYRFTRTADGNRVNTEWVRVVYNDNYTITLE